MPGLRPAPITVDVLLAEARRGLARLGPRECVGIEQRGGLVVDIRSDAQRATDGLVPGAHIVARNVLEWRFDPTVEHADHRMIAVRGPLVLMCNEGYQSSLAAANLIRIGVTTATDMTGGFVAWRAAGLPVVHP